MRQEFGSSIIANSSGGRTSPSSVAEDEREPNIFRRFW